MQNGRPSNTKINIFFHKIIALKLIESDYDHVEYI